MPRASAAVAEETEPLTLEQVVAAAQLRRKENQARFVDLARECASGRKVSATEIESVAREADRHLNEFAPLVESFKHRAKLRADAVELQPIYEAFQAAKRELEELNRKLEEQIQAFESAARPVQWRIGKLKDEFVRLQGIPAELIATCPCAEMKERNRELQSRAESANRSLSKIRETIEMVESEKPANELAETAQKHRLEKLRGDETRLNAIAIEVVNEQESLCKQMMDY